MRIEAFCTKNEDFDQVYLDTDSKTQNGEKLSLDLIFHNIFDEISKLLATKLHVNNSL